MLNNHLIQKSKIELTSFVEPFPRLYFTFCNFTKMQNVANAFSRFPDNVPGKDARKEVLHCDHPPQVDKSAKNLISYEEDNFKTKDYTYFKKTFHLFTILE